VPMGAFLFPGIPGYGPVHIDIPKCQEVNVQFNTTGLMTQINEGAVASSIFFYRRLLQK